MVKVLIIEDEDALRKDILEMLGYEGFEVLGAADGQQGIEAARKFLPELIICDIMMPGDIKGFDVLEALRGEKITALIPFIFLTARTDRMDQRLGMELGADDYVTKPFKISELLATIRTRLSKRQQLVEASEEKLYHLRENITTSLPHELRTPLNTIMGFSDMMREDAHSLQPEQIQEWAGMIHGAAMRLYRLIENYLTYARIETLWSDTPGQQQLQQKRTRNPATIIEFQMMARAHFHRREDDIVMRLDENAPVCIAEEDLKKIAEEVIDNAFKFSEAGTSVEVETGVTGGCFSLIVRDRGRGMTPEQIQAIGAYMQFERWLYEQQGMGLGLTISRRLTDLYQGTLKIDSVVQQGTTVSVLLPLA
ncbi:MAG: response regulator [Chloroflexi bacterium]|nr:response regulator [Chloroflexota bacterium]